MMWTINLKVIVLTLGIILVQIYATTIYDCSITNNLFINDPDYSITCCGSAFNLTFGSAIQTVTPLGLSGCSTLKSVTFSDNVTEVSDYAFDGAYFTSISFGNGLRRIGDFAFYRCTWSYLNLLFPDSLVYIGIWSFSSSYIYDASNTITSVVFGSGLQTISTYAFSFSRVATVVVSDSVEVIETGAFFGSAVESFVWGTGLTTIEYSALGNNDFATLELPEGLVILAKDALRYCRQLTTLYLPSTLTYIGDHAFAQDTSLTTINIPDSVTYIGPDAFSGDTSLTCVRWNSSIARNSSLPSDFASNCPPTMQPTYSLQPTVQPTTALPSMRQTSKPTTLLSAGPSLMPTFVPTAVPSRLPTFVPTGVSTAVPTAARTDSPSILPTIQPTMFPTCGPTFPPSIGPSANPSQYPTSTPTFVDCPLGYIHDFKSTVFKTTCHFCQCIPCLPGEFAPLPYLECIPSPSGHYSPINATDAFICPSGTYSIGQQTECSATPAGYHSSAGAPEPSLCPPNTYSAAGQESCTHCPAGVVSNAGSTSVAQCVSPKTSFGISFVGLVSSLVGFYVYIVGGRLHRIAFIRKHILIRNCIRMYNKLCDIILALRDHYRLYAPSRIDEKLYYWVRVALVAVCVFIVFVMFIFVFIYQTFYTCVIIYRGYVHLPNVGLPSLTRRFELYISVLEGFSFSVVRYLSYPFKYILNFLATLSIDFSGAQVSCVGAQIPMQLLANVLVIAVIVLVIESDMEVFWCSAFSNVHQEFRKLLIRPSLWENRILTIFKYMMWSICLQVIPHPRSLLQFVIGFFSLVPFFDDNYHAKHSPSCDVGSYYKVDSLLAYSSTVVAYAAVVPLLLIFSQILVPRFMIDRGGVKPKRYIQKRLLMKGNKCICGLPLIRHRAKNFEVSSCSSGPQCTCDGKPDFSVFYACPRYEDCEWILCRSCGNSIHDDMMFTAEYARSLIEGNVDIDSSTMESSLASGRVPLDRSKTMTSLDLNVVRSKSIVSNDEQKRSAPVVYAQYIGSLFALDWLYCRFAYSFGKSLVPILDPASYKFGHKLSWIAAHDVGEDEYERICLELEWTFLAGTAATYYRLVRTVQEDLTPPLKTYITCSSCELEIRERCYYRDGSNFRLCRICEAVHDNETRPVTIFARPISWRRYLMEFGLYLLSYTPMAQLCSERGRLIWRQVMLNYIIYLRAAVGWWSELETLNFGLMDRFADLLKNDAVLTHRNIFEPTPVLDKASIEDENIQVMSAVISSRLVLMQMIPYMTLFSAIAVNLCSCPILLRDKKLLEVFPPLFVVSDLTQMAKETLMDVGILPTWQVRPMCVYLFVRRSRGVQYLLNALTSIVAVIIVFSTDVKLVTGVMVFSLTLIAIQGAVASIFPIVLVHYLLFPSEKVVHCDVVGLEDEDADDEEEDDCVPASNEKKGDGAVVEAPGEGGIESREPIVLVDIDLISGECMKSVDRTISEQKEKDVEDAPIVVGDHSNKSIETKDVVLELQSSDSDVDSYNYSDGEVVTVRSPHRIRSPGDVIGSALYI